MNPEQKKPMPFCMICNREIGPGNLAVGPVLGAGPNRSHGVCTGCTPAYCDRYGLSAADKERITAFAKGLAFETADSR